MASFAADSSARRTAASAVCAEQAKPLSLSMPASAAAGLDRRSAVSARSSRGPPRRPLPGPAPHAQGSHLVLVHAQHGSLRAHRPISCRAAHRQRTRGSSDLLQCQGARPVSSGCACRFLDQRPDVSHCRGARSSLGVLDCSASDDAG